MNQAASTSDKLILAAIDLIAEQGYDGTTTKEIAAAAGVSEVTLFRHFGSKQALLIAAFERYHYAGEMTKLFNERLTWDVRTDLLLIGRTYHAIMNRNRKLLDIAHKGGSRLPEEVHKHASQHPVQLKKLLTNYFSTLLEQGKIAPDRSGNYGHVVHVDEFGGVQQQLGGEVEFGRYARHVYRAERRSFR